MSTHRVIATLALLATGAAGAAFAQEPAVDAAATPADAAAAPAPATPDLSAWPCRFCAFESGSSGWIEPRVGYISDSSFHFGDYRGLEDDGFLLDLSGAWRYRDADSADFLDLQVDRLGLDSRALSVRGGRQGSYRVSLGYDALPHRVARDSRTPFTGTEQLGLPAGWTEGGSTGGMAALDASLHPAWLQQERERSAIGLQLTPHRAADLRVDYRRDEISGTGAIGGSFMTLASQLPRPIDQTLDRADVSIALHNALGQAQLALASSFFTNDSDALGWQNPYSGPTASADRGQLALAPDNRAHRLSLTLASPPGAPLHTSAQISVGRMSQDERFLPATVNADEAVALPRGSLGGRVDTSFAMVRAVYRVLPGLRAVGDYLHDKRDNGTPVAAYTQVVMDTFTGDVRRNAPYGYQRDRWRLSVERSRGLRLALGIEDDTRERRLYGSAETQELRYWARLGWRPASLGDLRLRVTHADREGNEYASTPGAAAQNPLLRAYNTADRRRDEARADLAIGTPALTTTFNVIYARDDYPATVIGRTGGSEFGYGTDVAAQPTEDISISAFASRRLQDTEQAGSQGFGLPDWFADQEDATSVLGVHLNWQAPRGFEFGTDYIYSDSEGTIAMAAGPGETGFPLLVTRWHDARLYGRYALRPDLSLRLDLMRERYTAYDWALDGVAPDTVPNLLALGQGTQSGAVSAVLLGLRYEFRSAVPPAD